MTLHNHTDKPVKSLALSHNASSVERYITSNRHASRQPISSYHGKNNQPLEWYTSQCQPQWPLEYANILACEQYLARFHPLSQPYFKYAHYMEYFVGIATSYPSIEQYVLAQTHAKEADLTVKEFSGAPGQVLDDHVRAVIYQAKAANVHPGFFYTYLKRSFAPNIIEELNIIRAYSFEAVIVYLHQAYNPEVAREHLRTVIMADSDRYLSNTLPLTFRLMHMDLKLIKKTNHNDINTVLEKWIQSAPTGLFKVRLPITNTTDILGSIETVLVKSDKYGTDILSWVNMTGHEAIRSAEEKRAQQSNKS
ncbi:hypothetical protein GQ42DRAFT_160271 [Ramicandelaber brevisporus]|nr:hypothetical protein GQ42DRAFT_160271 [Ramicandelaber brevisporus]